MKSNYDKYPSIAISPDSARCDSGWVMVVDRLRNTSGSKGIICIECYPGVFEDEIEQALRRCFSPAEIFRTRECLKPSSTIDRMLTRDLSEDPVFGRLSSLELIDFFDEKKLSNLRRAVSSAGAAVILGTGALLGVEKPRLLVYADLARWEIQQRQRRGEVSNFASGNFRRNGSGKV